MKHFLTILVAWLSLLSLPVHAGPGAHSPNGEHLDAPSPANSGTTSSPRLEAKTDQFELVASLAAGELSILIDRFETNEPLLNATVEVESGGLKAKARLHADHGDYVVDDAALLKLLSQPGAHALVFTVVAGQESDLLDGTLNVLEHPAEADHIHGREAGSQAESGLAAKRLGFGLALALLLGLAGFLWRRRRAHFAFNTARGDTP